MRGHALTRSFPRNRDEALKITEEIHNDVRSRGCVCRQLKVEFIEPPGRDGYVSVTHDLTCPLAFQ